MAVHSSAGVVVFRFVALVAQLSMVFALRPAHAAGAPLSKSSFLQMESSLQARVFAWASNNCKKNLWMTMDTCVTEFADNTTYVITGDIDAMWIRDSTAQVWPYLIILEQGMKDKEIKSSAELASLQRLSRMLAGTLRRQAKFQLTDPYANAFTSKFNSEKDKRLGRGAYVFTGNYELDSGVYFLRFFVRMATLELEHFGPDNSVLSDATVRDAVTMLLALYRQERDHAYKKSSYVYPLSPPWELPGRGGMGNPANWTGMVWGAFRPSDDPQKYAYNIPGNLFLASVLGPLSALVDDHWEESGNLVTAMQDLRSTILQGVEKHGTTPATKAGLVGSEKIYCYEVDGLGNCLLMDDANVPSLLSLPYLDPTRTVFDEETYSATRRFILSVRNDWYFTGADGAGIGSPHTGRNSIWPLALVMQAMTTTDKFKQDELLQMIWKAQLKSSAQNGLSESFYKDDASRITRPWFAWPNSLLAEFLMGQGGCSPDLAELEAHLPKDLQIEQPFSANVGGVQPVQFYLAPVAQMRRAGVKLPAKDYYP